MKKRLTSVSGIILLLAFSLVSSCSTENESSDKTTGALSAKAAAVGPENAKNPYDKTGELHNAVMQMIFDDRANFNGDLEQTVSYGNTILTEKYEFEESDLPTVEEVKTVLSDSLSFYKNNIANSSYSEGTKEGLNKLMVIIENAASNEKTTYSSFKDEIVSFEDDILAGSLTEQQKTEILQVTSITRYSTYFWNTKYSGQYETTTALFGKRKWWKWLIIGVADSAGGITGGIAGSPTVVGIAAGAVAGAVGTSAGALALVDAVWPEDPATTTP